MEDKSPPFKRKRRPSDEGRPPHRPRTKFVPRPAPPPPTSSTFTPGYGQTSATNWNPFASQGSSYEQPQRTSRRPVSAAVGSSEQGYITPPIDLQISLWDPFQDEDIDIKDDPSIDSSIRYLREQFERESQSRSGSIQSMIEPPFRRACAQNLGAVQANIRNRYERGQKRNLDLILRGYYQSGSTYQPLEMRPKIDPGKRKMLFPKRKRTFEQIMKNSKELRARSHRRPSPKWRFKDPIREKVRRLSSRSRKVLAGVRQDPDLQKRAEARKKQRHQWRHLLHRKVYQKSQYKMDDLNIRIAKLHLGTKRDEIYRGSTSAPNFSRFYKPVVPGIKGLTTIGEGMEPRDTGPQYYPH